MASVQHAIPHIASCSHSIERILSVQSVESVFFKNHGIEPDLESILPGVYTSRLRLDDYSSPKSSNQNGHLIDASFTPLQGGTANGELRFSPRKQDRIHMDGSSAWPIFVGFLYMLGLCLS